MKRPPSPPLFRSRRFLPLWLAVCESAFTDNMLRQALIIAIVYGAVSIEIFKDPADAIPIMGALFSAATLAFTSIAGQVAEKYETGSLLKRIKLAEVALMFAAAIGFIIQSGLMLMIVFIGFSVQVAFFNPVRIAALPKYLNSQELVRGNAYCSAGLFIAVVLGLYFGGVLIAAPQGRYIVSAWLVAAAASALAAVFALPKAPGDMPHLRIDWNPVGQTIRVLAIAFREKGVWRPLAAVAFFYVVSTATTIIVPLYAIEELGADGAAATAIMGVFAVGAGVGAIAASLISRRRSGLGFSFFGVTGAGLTTAFVYWLTDIVAATGASASVSQLMSHRPGVALLAAFALSSGFMGLYLVPLQAASQRRAPDGKRARVLAAGNMFNAVCAMIGSLCVLIVTNTPMSPADGLLILAAMQLCIGSYMAARWFSLPSGFHDHMLRDGEQRSGNLGAKS